MEFCSSAKRIQRWRREFGQFVKWKSWGVSRNWLRVFSALEFAYKPQQERVFVDTSEPVRIPLLWCSRWRNASHGKGFQRI